jgi:antitoxin HicB
MHGYTYVATLTPASEFAADEAGFVVTFADLPEAITQGEDETDALAQAADALEEAVAGRMKRGEVLPTPTDKQGHRVTATAGP